MTFDVIGHELGKLAIKLTEDAVADGVKSNLRLEIFKALTTYYVNTTKISKKIDQPEEDQENFNGFRKRIEQTKASGDPKDRPT